MSELLDWLISDAKTVDIWIKRWFKQKSEVYYILGFNAKEFKKHKKAKHT